MAVCVGGKVSAGVRVTLGDVGVEGGLEVADEVGIWGGSVESYEQPLKKLNPSNVANKMVKPEQLHLFWAIISSSSPTLTSQADSLETQIQPSSAAGEGL